MVKCEDLRSKIRSDIIHLQLAKSQSEFDAAKLLWLKKWDSVDSAKEFVQYFNLEYLKKYDGWFEGRALNSPSTNNCLEATNNVIKNEGTLRERLPLNRFIDVAKELIKEWSINRNPESPNPKIFFQKPKLTLKLQTDSYNWARNNPKIRTSTRNNLKSYFISPSTNADLKPADVDKFLKASQRQSWRFFDTYVIYQSQLWFVQIESQQWENGSCTCPGFLKNYICKHLLGIAITEKYFQVQPEAKNVPIGQKRKRGRPSKATKALLRQ